MNKICRICKLEKNYENFHKSKRHLNGLKNECADCTNKYLRDRYEIYKINYKKNNRENHFKRKFKITYSNYLFLFQQRKGKCDICNKECKPSGSQDKNKNYLVVDHCHKTNRVRGLLCQQCNQAIGMFKDSLDILADAYIYLLNDGDIREHIRK